MTIKELKELIADCSDDMPVLFSDWASCVSEITEAVIEWDSQTERLSFILKGD